MSFISASLKEAACVWSVTVEEDEHLIRRVLQFLNDSGLLFLGEDDEIEIGDDGHGHKHGNDISTKV